MLKKIFYNRGSGHGCLCAVFIIALITTVAGCLNNSLFMVATTDSLPPFAPIGMTVNLMAQGLGVLPENVRFSWQVVDQDQNELQSAYRIIVSSSLKNSKNGYGDVWDSGRVYGSDSISVKYAGQPLDPGGFYYWRVMTWDKNWLEGSFCEPQFLATAPDGFSSTWSGPAGHEAEDVFYARTVFFMPGKKIEKAVAHVSFGSEYRFFVNGKTAGLMASGGAKDEQGYLIFRTFDITDKLPDEDSGVCLALIGRGDAFCFKALIRFVDGTEVIIDNGSGWKIFSAAEGFLRDKAGLDGTCGGLQPDPVSYAYYEHLDARALPTGNWANPDYDDSEWLEPPALGARGTLVPAMKNPVVEQYVEPTAVTHVDEKTIIVDFGRELLGGLSLLVEGRAGDELDVRMGEELREDGSVVFEMRTGMIYRELWTLSGSLDLLEHLGIRAFRYAELKGPEDVIDRIRVKARALHTVFDESASEFNSSDPDLNALWEFGKYTAKALSLELWTDSEARERIPYAGDYFPAQVSAYVAGGEYTVPRKSLEYVLYHPTWPVIYKGLTVYMFYRDYLYSGDNTALATHYSALKAVVDEMLFDQNGLVKVTGDLSHAILDWLPSSPENDEKGEEDGLVKMPVGTGVNAVGFAALKSMADIAGALGYEDESMRYSLRAERLRGAINKFLWDAGQGCYVDGLGTDHTAMHSTAFPAAFGVPEQEMYPAIINFLENKGQVGGVFGAQFYYNALYRGGAGDVAYKALMDRDTMRNWFHMLEIGATTTAEAWDPALKPNMTWSHLWGNAIPNIIACGIMGIKPLKPGFEKIQIRPQPGGLKTADIRIPTVRGQVRVAFERDKKSVFDMIVEIPPNMKAEIHVPVGLETAGELEWNGQIVEGKIAGGFLIVDNVGSGTHRLGWGSVSQFVSKTVEAGK